jgi:hypothetical protein
MSVVSAVPFRVPSVSSAPLSTGETKSERSKLFDSSFEAARSIAIPAPAVNPTPRAFAPALSEVKDALERIKTTLGDGSFVTVEDSKVSLHNASGALEYGFDVRGNLALVTVGPDAIEAGQIQMQWRPGDLVEAIVGAGEIAKQRNDYALWVGSDWQTGFPQVAVRTSHHDTADWTFTQQEDGQLHFEFQSFGPTVSFGVFPPGDSPMTAVQSALEVSEKVWMLPRYQMTATGKDGQPSFVLSGPNADAMTYAFDVNATGSLRAIKYPGANTGAAQTIADAVPLKNEGVEALFRSGKIEKADFTSEKSLIAQVTPLLERRAGELNAANPNARWEVTNGFDEVGRTRLLLCDSGSAAEAQAFVFDNLMMSIEELVDAAISWRDVGTISLLSTPSVALATYFAADRIGRELGTHELTVDAGARGGNAYMLKDLSGSPQAVDYLLYNQYTSVGVSTSPAGGEPTHIAGLQAGEFARTELEAAVGAFQLVGKVDVKPSANGTAFEIQARGNTYQFTAIAHGEVAVRKIAPTGETTQMPSVKLGETPLKSFLDYARANGIL